MAGAIACLWLTPRQPWSHTAATAAALAVAVWAWRLTRQARLGVAGCLMVQGAALATVSSALHWPAVHLLSKPLPLLIAIFLIAMNDHSIKTERRFHSIFGARGWLVAALAASLLGDVLLMGPQHWFVGGLLAFLVAHLCYLVLLSRDAPWWHSRLALAFTLGAGAAMTAWLWPGLPAALRIPVGVYVTAIALMVAQALGRAQALGTPQARWVGLGAGLFMLSDSLLAVNRFMQPLPLAGLWVLATYFSAQICIAANVLPTRTPGLFYSENS